MSDAVREDLRGFAWRMAPLQRVTEWARDRAALRLAELMREEEAASEGSRQLTQQHHRNLSFASERFLDGGLHAQRLAYLAHLQELRAQAEHQHALLRDQVEVRRAQYVACMRAAQGLQRLRGQAQRQHAVQLRNQEAREADRSWLVLARLVGDAEVAG